jgi:hypothetical protein
MCSLAYQCASYSRYSPSITKMVQILFLARKNVRALPVFFALVDIIRSSQGLQRARADEGSLLFEHQRSISFFESMIHQPSSIIHHQGIGIRDNNNKTKQNKNS